MLNNSIVHLSICLGQDFILNYILMENNMSDS